MTYDPARMVSFDCETHLIQDGLLAPPLVCASVAALEGGKIQGQILDRDQARTVFARLLRSDAVIVGANIAYDMLIMAVAAARAGEDLIGDIFRAYDEGRVFDVQIAESLHAVAGGHLGKHPDGSPLRDAKGRVTTRYSLDTCVRLTLGRDNAKVNDRWRLRYHELEHLPIAEWPEEAKIYPVDDAVNTLEVALAQVGRNRNLHDLAAQCRAAWALHLGASWGFRVDGVALDVLEARVTEAREAGEEHWKALGLLREDGSQDLSLVRAKVARAYGSTETCPDCGGRCAICDGSGKVPGARGLKKCTECHGDGTPRCGMCGSTNLALAAAVPRTEKGGIAYGRDALRESGDEALMEFADWTEDAKIANVYVPYLRAGVSAPLNLRPNVLLETGRASYSGVIQLLPREGGIRECIVSRPGTVLVSCDYGGLELATHAQSCLWLVGRSELAKALNGGIKVHDAMGARLGGISYEEILERNKTGDKKVKAWRQAAKAANFGFPGGMGGPKLVLQQRKQGPDTTAADGTKYKGLRLCVLLRGALVCGERKITEWKERPLPPTCLACVECAEDLRTAWLEQWPENRDYFRGPVSNASDRGWMEQHVSKRIRGGVSFTSAANGYFQGLAADGAKLALYRTSRECYVDRTSALYGSRVILFAHDELIVEVPEAQAHEAAARVSAVMVQAMREFVPDVVVTAEPALMRRWYKGAEPKHVDGRLVPWEPEKKAA
jgi:hypothetical protein